MKRWLHLKEPERTRFIFEAIFFRLDSFMELDEYHKMFELEESRYWWFMGNLALVAPWLKQYAKGTVLDIGCGTGFILKQIPSGIGVDLSPLALRYCQSHQLNRIICASAYEIPVPSASVDCVVLFHILEHLEDESRALQEFFRVLKPGGILLLAVPAVPFLFSDHDRALHHYRRYSLRQLRHTLTQHHYQVIRITYQNFFLFFPAFVVRLLQHLADWKPKIIQTTQPKFPQWLNEKVIRLYEWESRWNQQYPFPWGLSLGGIARKS